MLNGILFDLDNTLYDEWQYMSAAFQEVSHAVSPMLHRPPEVIYQMIVHEFNERGSLYPYLFNHVLERCAVESAGLISSIVDIFHSVAPPLTLYPGVRELLDLLRPRYKLALITNGRVETQRRKVKLLDIDGSFDTIIYPQEHGKQWEKPSPHPFLSALKSLSLTPSEAVYIGDNPLIDFAGARQAGIRTIRVLQGEFAPVRLGAIQEAETTIEALTELPTVLAAWERSSI